MMLSLAAAAGTDTQQLIKLNLPEVYRRQGEGGSPSGGVAFCDESMFLVLICCFWSCVKDSLCVVCDMWRHDGGKDTTEGFCGSELLIFR